MLQQRCHVASLEFDELCHGINTIQRQIRVKPVCETFELHVVPWKKMERMERGFRAGSTIDLHNLTSITGGTTYYSTGAITASGGSWNAAIVAEVASWGNTRLEANGLGAYIADATANGDMGRVVLGVVVMSIFVLLFNRLLWRPLYGYSERHLKLG